MKILVLSLLRIGDIIAQEPLIRGLRSQFPQARIHFLINDQFLNVSSICPEVDVWKGLPRHRLQSLLAGSASQHDEAFDVLINLAEDLNAEEYDSIYNFTNNYLSARLMDLLKAPKKLGSQFENGSKRRPLNRWEDYLNEHISANQPSEFTLLETMSMAFEIPLPEPVSGKDSRRDFNNEEKPRPIYLQVLTSDSKKNWGLQNFKQLYLRLRSEEPRRSLKVLCSEAEKPLVAKYFDSNDIFCAGLPEVQEQLKGAALLVTGDTSIQHLAANVGCPILSLFLGSADATKTPPYSAAAHMIRSYVECYPCRHSDPCQKLTHLCAEEISGESVLSKILSILKSPSVDERSSSIKSAGPIKFQNPRSYSGAAQLIERSLWNSYLSQEKVNFEFLFSIIKQEYLEQYLLNSRRFADAANGFLAELGHSSSAQDMSSLKKYFSMTDPEFRSCLLKISRNIFDTSELRDLNLIRLKANKDLTNYLRNTYGRQWTEPTQEYFSEA